MILLFTYFCIKLSIVGFYLFTAPITNEIDVKLFNNLRLVSPNVKKQPRFRNTYEHSIPIQPTKKRFELS